MEARARSRRLLSRSSPRLLVLSSSSSEQEGESLPFISFFFPFFTFLCFLDFFFLFLDFGLEGSEDSPLDDFLCFFFLGPGDSSSDSELELHSLSNSCQIMKRIISLRMSLIVRSPNSLRENLVGFTFGGSFLSGIRLCSSSPGASSGRFLFRGGSGDGRCLKGRGLCRRPLSRPSPPPWCLVSMRFLSRSLRSLSRAASINCCGVGLCLRSSCLSARRFRSKRLRSLG